MLLSMGAICEGELRATAATRLTVVLCFSRLAEAARLGNTSDVKSAENKAGWEIGINWDIVMIARFLTTGRGWERRGART